jgi:hypothetical protein
MKKQIVLFDQITQRIAQRTAEEPGSTLKTSLKATSRGRNAVAVV